MLLENLWLGNEDLGKIILIFFLLYVKSLKKKENRLWLCLLSYYTLNRTLRFFDICIYMLCNVHLAK